MDIKNISYSTVLSHAFPGILLELQIFLAVGLFSPVDILAKISSFVQANVSNLLSCAILFFVLATILGFILDGIHHYIFRKQEEKVYGIYRYMTSLERLEIVRSLLDDDLWYPYEAYANIWIAMMPGVVLLPYWMLIHNFGLALVVVIMAIYLIVFAIMRHEAVSTLEEYKEVENELIKAFQCSRPEVSEEAEAAGSRDK